MRLPGTPPRWLLATNLQSIFTSITRRVNVKVTKGAWCRPQKVRNSFSLTHRLVVGAAAAAAICIKLQRNSCSNRYDSGRGGVVNAKITNGKQREWQRSQLQLGNKCNTCSKFVWNSIRRSRPWFLWPLCDITSNNVRFIRSLKAAIKCTIKCAPVVTVH